MARRFRTGLQALAGLTLVLSVAACTPDEAPGQPTRINTAAVEHELRVISRSTYLPGVPFLVRVDALTPMGDVDRELWDATATLSVVQGDVTLSSSSVRLFNGRGSVLVKPTGSGAFTLAVSLGGATSSRSLTSLADAPVTEASGTLTEVTTRWEGVVHVGAQVDVPDGHELVVAPGTLVLIDGQPSGSEGVDIVVRGSIQIEGTDDAIVTFTASDPTRAWGELSLDTAEASHITGAEITLGGRSPTIGHARVGPVLRVVGSELLLERSAVTDLPGKIMWADVSTLTIRDVTFARSAMGPEVKATPALIEDAWISEMYGPDDNDGLYIRDFTEGQLATVSHTSIAVGDDDALDVHFANVELSDVILRDFFDKGTSIDAGTVLFHKVLIFGNNLGIVGKNPSSSTVVRSTIIGNTETGLWAKYDPAHKVTLNIAVRSSIVWGNGEDLLSDRGPADIPVTYSNIGMEWEGEGVLEEDPLFEDIDTHDYRLRPGSPSINTGAESDGMDVDGSRADQGFYATSDDDGDGYTEEQGDCADDQAAIYPGAHEVAGGDDDDCDGAADEDLPVPTPTLHPETPSPTAPTPSAAPTPSLTPQSPTTPTAQASSPTGPSPTPSPTSPATSPTPEASASPTPTPDPDPVGCTCSQDRRGGLNLASLLGFLVGTLGLRRRVRRRG